MKFIYHERSNEDYERRANQRGSNLERFTKEEYRTYNAQKSENCIRILPPSNQWPAGNQFKRAPHYGLDIYVHYSIGPSTGVHVLCPAEGAPQIGKRGEFCPICQERDRVKRGGDDELARDLSPTKRVLMYVINRKDEAQGVLLYPMPYTLDREIVKISRNPRNGTWYYIDRPEDGYDVYFDRTGDGKNTRYAAPQLADRQSPVNPKYVDWVNDNPLYGTLFWHTAEDIQRLFEGHGSGEEASDERSERPRRPAEGDEERSERPRRDVDEDEERSERLRRRADEAAHSERPRRDAERTDDRPPERTSARGPMRRPNSNANAAPPGNGTDADSPPFDGGKPTPPPSNEGRVRADEVRAKFMTRRE